MEKRSHWGHVTHRPGWCHRWDKEAVKGASGLELRQKTQPKSKLAQCRIPAVPVWSH